MGPLAFRNRLGLWCCERRSFAPTLCPWSEAWKLSAKLLKRQEKSAPISATLCIHLPFVMRASLMAFIVFTSTMGLVNIAIFMTGPYSLAHS